MRRRLEKKRDGAAKKPRMLRASRESRMKKKGVGANGDRVRWRGGGSLLGGRYLLKKKQTGKDDKGNKYAEILKTRWQTRSAQQWGEGKKRARPGKTRNGAKRNRTHRGGRGYTRNRISGHPFQASRNTREESKLLGGVSRGSKSI